MSNNQIKSEMAKFQKHLNEMSPARRKAIDEAFFLSTDSPEPPYPPMRQMSF